MRLASSAALVALTVIMTPAAVPPKLAVLIVVDQMRADYVDRFQPDWSAGLKRLVTNGAWFTRAAYPYLDTVTCAGHATIATGTFPSTHGIFQNTWFDRGRNAMVTCTEDSSVKAVPYGKAVTGNDSAARLLVPTFPEEMRRQKGSRVVALSLKARSAIMLAGHRGDAVTWRSESLDGWETSTAFTPMPVPAVQAYVSAHRVEADYGKTWTRLLPASRYADADEGLGERPPSGWTREFPHILSGNVGDSLPGDAYYQQWERSPYADAYLGRMAAGLADAMQLGTHDTTDVLAVSFSSPDLVGHAFGPRSQEVRDMFAQLDRTIGTLLDRLDALVGAHQYVVALTADHGVTEIPEQLKAEGRDGGRIDLAGVVQAIEDAARKALGPGKYVTRASYNDVYFAPGAFGTLTRNRTAMDAVMKAVSAQPGIARVFRGDELARAASSSDAVLGAAALSYVPERRGHQRHQQRRRHQGHGCH